MQELFEPLVWSLVSQAELGIESIEETGTTFVENALLKARHVARASGLPSIADDSGLVVDALGGAPGIYSARYAGEPSNDSANNDKLLGALAGIPEAQRTAHFSCTMVFVEHPDHADPIVAQGRWHGRILEHPRGDNGFGYDPLFFLQEHQCTSAEMPAAQKNAMSHRGQAAKALLAALR